MWPAPRKLCGTRLSLLPLTHSHAAQLAQATQSGSHIPEGCRLPVSYDMQEEISDLLERQADGLALTYSVQSPDSRLLGWAGFSAIDRAHKKLEIGNVWIASSDPETFTEMMVMLMTYGFEVAGANTIRISSLASNSAHRKRLEKLGTHLDGILRGDQVSNDGTPQDVAVYSFIKTEWANKCQALLAQLS